MELVQTSPVDIGPVRSVLSGGRTGASGSGAEREMGSTIRLFSEERVAELFDVHVDTIRRMRRAEELPYVRLRGAIRYREEDLRRWLEANLFPKPTAVDLRLAELARL